VTAVTISCTSCQDTTRCSGMFHSRTLPSMEPLQGGRGPVEQDGCSAAGDGDRVQRRVKGRRFSSGQESGCQADWRPRGGGAAASLQGSGAGTASAGCCCRSVSVSAAPGRAS
jgi:hypothetical protein